MKAVASGELASLLALSGPLPPSSNGTVMKALQSPLAKKVLADNQARTQLRQVVSLASRRGEPDASEQTILLREGATVRRLTAVVVPKAA
jgi:hypothetical protein